MDIAIMRTEPAAPEMTTLVCDSSGAIECELGVSFTVNDLGI